MDGTLKPIPQVFFAIIVVGCLLHQTGQAEQPSPSPSVTLGESKAEFERRIVAEQQAKGLLPRNDAPKWTYSEHEDEKGRGADKFAYLISLNTVTFGVPYEGQQHARLCLQSNPKLGKDVIFQIERGQFLSSHVHNFVTVTFDNGESEKFVVGNAVDGQSDLLFIRPYDRFVNQLKKAKTLKIEASFSKEGEHVFEFDVHGLKW